jgi:hypothetical protein
MKSTTTTRPASRIARNTLLLVVVAASCYLAYGFGKLWAEWRVATQPPPTREASSAGVELMPSALPLSGPWTFAELDWNVRSTLVDLAAVEARFATPPAPLESGEVSHLPDVSQELLDLAETLQLRPVEQAGHQVYQHDRPDLKARLVVRKVADRTKVVSIFAAYPLTGGQWQMFELSPRGSAMQATTASDHLLPLPAAAVRRGGRFADDGRLLLELISLDTNPAALVASWKQAGWEVRPSGLGDPKAFSFLCRKGDGVVYAWSASAAETLHNLILVRSPTDGEIEALQQQYSR